MMSTRVTNETSLPALAVLVAAVALVMAGPAEAQKPAKHGKWQQRLATDLNVLGHRNWVVVADRAYPAQSRAGIETIYVGGDQLSAVRQVLAAVDKAPHVRAIVYHDAELDSVPEKHAQGIGKYRDALGKLLEGRPTRELAHEKIIGELDEAAKTFRVLIIKTDMTLPYTSVFLQLDCGYWSAEAEQALRAAIKNKGK